MTWSPRPPVVGLLGATALSTAGNAAVAVILPWLVLSRTGSPTLAGLVSATAVAAMVPALVVGGALLDRWPRRQVSIAADLASAAAVVALPIVDTTVGLSVLTILVLVALGAAFDGPGAAARESMRPEIARAARTPLDRLHAHGEVAEQLGNIAGPGLAGIALAVIGTNGSLWLAGGCFAVAAAATAAWIPRTAPHARPTESVAAATWSGLRHLWHDRVLRVTALAGTAVVCCVAPIVLILTVHLERQGQATALGLVLAAFAAGGIVGALGYGAIAGRVHRRTALLSGLVGGAVGLAALAVLPAPPLLAAIAFVIGVAFGPVNPVAVAIVQDRAPEALRGRVVATVGSLSLLGTPLAIGGVGALLEVASPAVALLASAAGCIASAAVIAIHPALRRVERTDLIVPPTLEHTS